MAGNLGPKLLHVNPDRGLPGGLVPIGSLPQGKGPKAGPGRVKPSLPSPHTSAFSNLETSLNWVLIGHFHPSPWNQRVGAKPSQGGHRLSGAVPSMSLLCEGWCFIHWGKTGTFGVLGTPHVPQHRCLGSTLVWQEDKSLFKQGLKPPPFNPAPKGDVPVPLLGPPPCMALTCTPWGAAPQPGLGCLCLGIWVQGVPSPGGPWGTGGPSGAAVPAGCISPAAAGGEMRLRGITRNRLRPLGSCF